MDLDELDHALLEELRLDGRASFETLGARVGLSRTAARARVQRILDSGVLQVVAMVHPEFEGIRAFAHVSIAVDATPAAQVASAVAALAEAPFVSIVSGHYSVIAEIRGSDNAQLADSVSAIRGIDGVMYADTVLYTHLVKEPPVPAIASGRLEHFDETDRRLLALLRNDGRLPFADLAEQVGLSKGATRARVLRLLDSGVVAITGIVNPTAIGITHMTGFQLRLESEGTAALNEIDALEPVDFLARTLGRCDAVGSLITRTRAETIETLDRIRAVRGVRDLQSWTHLELVKEHYDRRPVRVLAQPSSASAEGSAAR